MDTLVQIGLTNALLATALALLAAMVSKAWRRPALAHALWLLVLLKLLTPPLVVVPIAWTGLNAKETAAVPMGSMVEPPALQEVVAAGPLPQLEIAALEQFGQPGLPPIEAEPVQLIVPFDQKPGVPAELAEPAVGLPLAASPEPTGTMPEIPWLTLLAWTWLGGSAVWFAIALLRIWRFQRALTWGYAASPSLQREASDVAVRLGLRDCPVVWLVPGVVSPLLWAIAGTPKLLLPADLLRRLDTVQRQTLLAHELAHYTRRDHWVRCLEFAALGLYWWFPVMWWARRELRNAEEECCDGWVMWTLPGAAKAYAGALVETLDFLSGSRSVLPPVASGLGHLNLMQRRLTMIMRGTMPRKLGGLGLLAVLALAALLLPMVPTWAQQDQQGQNQQPKIILRGDGVIKDVILKFDQPPGDDLAKARRELEKASKELEKFQAEINRMQAELQRRMQELQAAQEKLRAAERASGKREDKKGAVEKDRIIIKGKDGATDPGVMKMIMETLQKNGVDPEQIRVILENVQKGGPEQMKVIIERLDKGGFVPGIPLQQGGLDKRVGDLERKLDMVLNELQDLRRAMGKGPGVPATPGNNLPKDMKKGGQGGGGGGGQGGGGGGGGGQGGPGNKGGGGGGQGGPGGQGGGGGKGGQGGGAGFIIVDPSTGKILSPGEAGFMILDPSQQFNIRIPNSIKGK